MKMNAWVAESAANLRISQSSLRMRLYRGVIPMPRRTVTNQRVMEVLDAPLSAAPCGTMPAARCACASPTSGSSASISTT